MRAYEKKINIVTLGCSKNLVDSEKIAAQLHHSANEIAHNADETNFDVVIINTCGFIEAAKEESIDAIMKWVKEKEKGNVKKVLVTGCLSQRYRGELQAAIPEIDAWFGTMEMAQLISAMNADYKKELLGARILSTPKHYAYLKISEGCNRTCSFCAIPLMRGEHVSRPIETLIEEASLLSRQGVKELLLIAQELTYYGLDIYKKRSLHMLLEEMARIKGLQRIRLHYAYPHKFPLDIIAAMKKHDVICNYLDMPLQHASDRILQSMRRQITQKEMRDLLGSIRLAIPSIALRTTMIVGYPGETDEDFQILADFIEEQRFDRLGVFMYSNEEGTAAYSYRPQVKKETKERRYETLMNIQRRISEENNTSTVGSITAAMIDKKENGFYVARTEKDSPEVDNELFIFEAPDLEPGDMVEARIVQAYEYDREAVFLNKAFMR